MIKKAASSLTLVLLLSHNVVAMDDVPCVPVQKPTSFVSRARGLARAMTAATMAFLLAGATGAQDLSRPTRLSEVRPAVAAPMDQCLMRGDFALHVAQDRIRAARRDYCTDMVREGIEFQRVGMCPADVDPVASGCHGDTGARLDEALHRDLQDVDRLLKDCGADIEYPGRRYTEWPPLHSIAYRNHVQMAELLIRRGATIHGTGKRNGTALHHVSGDFLHRGGDDMVRLLLCVGSELDARNEFGSTPLHYASMSGASDVVRRLVLSGAQVNAMSNEGDMPLHRAAGHCDAKTVVFLVEHGAQVNAAGWRGEMPLHDAVVAHPENVAVLLEHGAAIEARDDDGRTPLHQAAISVCVESVKLLLAAGANRSVVDNDGKTPLQLVRPEVWRNEEVIQLLSDEEPPKQERPRFRLGWFHD